MQLIGEVKTENEPTRKRSGVGDREAADEPLRMRDHNCIYVCLHVVINIYIPCMHAAIYIYLLFGLPQLARRPNCCCVKLGGELQQRLAKSVGLGRHDSWLAVKICLRPAYTHIYIYMSFRCLLETAFKPRRASSTLRSINQCFRPAAFTPEFGCTYTSRRRWRL